MPSANMNHIHLSVLSRIGPSYLKIPYRCTSYYDNGSLLTYPDRQGWKVDVSYGHPNPILHRRVKHQDSELEAFLQTWL